MLMALWSAFSGHKLWLSAFLGVLCLRGATYMLRNFDLSRRAWRTILAPCASITVCWFTSITIIRLSGLPLVRVGPGLEWWNLPGTCLGMVIWASALVHDWKVLKAK